MQQLALNQIDWLKSKMYQMSETMELSGAKSMYIENNCHKAVKGMKEELENRATREQINKQL